MIRDTLKGKAANNTGLVLYMLQAQVLVQRQRGAVPVQFSCPFWDVGKLSPDDFAYIFQRTSDVSR